MKRFDVDLHFAYEFTTETEAEAERLGIEALTHDLANGNVAGALCEIEVKEVQ